MAPHKSVSYCLSSLACLLFCCSCYTEEPTSTPPYGRTWYDDYDEYGISMCSRTHKHTHSLTHTEPTNNKKYSQIYNFSHLRLFIAVSSLEATQSAWFSVSFSLVLFF